MGQGKVYTVKQALPKMAAYCAYQERCYMEVEKKLYEYGLDEDEIYEVIQWLRNEKFLDEERYARSYVRGKFNRNKWGRYKIKQGLKQKKIEGRLADLAMEEIDGDVYYDVLKDILRKKREGVSSLDLRTQRSKCFIYASNKGFESDLIQDAFNEILQG